MGQEKLSPARNGEKRLLGKVEHQSVRLCNSVAHWRDCMEFHGVTALRVRRKEEQTGVVRRDMTLKNLLEYRLILQVTEIIEGV